MVAPGSTLEGLMALRALVVFLLVNLGIQIGVGVGLLMRGGSYQPDRHIVFSLVGVGAGVICAILAVTFPRLFRRAPKR